MPNAILNKGGAGVSITREETIERLNPIIERLSGLNHRYAAAIDKLAHQDHAADLKAHLMTSRVDVGKLSETVLSAGGVPYNAVDLEPENFVAEGSDDEILEHLRDEERQMQDALRQESKVRHHIRTEAILMNVRRNSEARMATLERGKDGR